MTTLWAKAKEASSMDLLHNNNTINNNNNIGSRSNNARAVVKRTASSSLVRQQAAAMDKLQNELNEATIKHAEAVYWLQLELDTTRSAKKAVEDRMAELYRDVQELNQHDAAQQQQQQQQHEYPQQQSSPQPIIPRSAEYVEQQHKQVEKYERMLRIMNNQILLVRSSSDELVKSLKDEISVLMDEKVRTELSLTNKLSALDYEKRELEQKLVASNEKVLGARTKNENSSSRSSSSNPPPSSSPNRGDAVRPPQPPRRHKSIDDDDGNDDDATTILLREDLMRLRAENELLRQNQQIATPENGAQIDTLKKTIQQLTVQNNRLDSELISERNKARERLVLWTEEKVSLEDEVEALRRRESDFSEERTQWVRENREAATASLDRVALLWDRTDEAVQTLEGAVMEIRSNNHHQQDAERLLSLQETASMVNCQVKVSLMLIELKLRNSLACLENDPSSERGLVVGSDELRALLRSIQAEAMNSIGDVKALAEEQIERLRSQSIEESVTLRELHEAKVVDLRQMLHRQEQLEEELTKIRASADRAGPSGTIDLFVSPEALETLQNEVLQVVERVKEKNETIGRLMAEIEEHKVRERTLMEELKRHMKDQADRQLLEQQRIMQQNAQFRDSEDSNSEDGSSEYEEKTVDDSIYEETTIYEDEAVM